MNNDQIQERDRQPGLRPGQVNPLDLVQAKLKRLPQDRLQAAVVLEAFAGQKAPHSFNVSADQLPETVGSEEPVTQRKREAPGTRVTDFAVLFTIVASAILWMPSLEAALANELGTVVAWGLPSALALDGAVRIRHLSSGNVRSLRPSISYLNVVLASCLLAALLLRPGAAAAVALVVLWGQATILSVRGWYLRYIALAAATTVGLWLIPSSLALPGTARTADAVLVLTAAALIMLGLTTRAVLTDVGEVKIPEPISAAAAACVIGGSSGFMLVGDDGVWQTASLPTTLAVLLVTATGWVASVRLTRIWVDLPTRLANVPIGPGKPTSSRSITQTVSRTIVAASARIVLPTFASLAAYVAVDTTRGAAVVCAFSCFALATLAMSLNMATGYWAASAVIAIVGAAITVGVPSTTAGLPLLLGSAFVICASGSLAYLTFRDSTVAFVTRMMIR